MINNEVRKIEMFKQLLKQAFVSIQKANRVLFRECDDFCGFESQTLAGAYINNANSLICAAKAVYISNLEFLERDEIENIFSKFDIYKDEFLENYTTNHSHQWTDIEYNRLIEAAKLFDIPLLFNEDD